MSEGSQRSKRSCAFFARGRCRRSACEFLHAAPPPQESAPTPLGATVSSSSTNGSPFKRRQNKKPLPADSDEDTVVSGFLLEPPEPPSEEEDEEELRLLSDFSSSSTSNAEDTERDKNGGKKRSSWLLSLWNKRNGSPAACPSGKPPSNAPKSPLSKKKAEKDRKNIKRRSLAPPLEAPRGSSSESEEDKRPPGEAALHPKKRRKRRLKRRMRQRALYDNESESSSSSSSEGRPPGGVNSLKRVGRPKGGTALPLRPPTFDPSKFRPYYRPKIVQHEGVEYALVVTGVKDTGLCGTYWGDPSETLPPRRSRSRKKEDQCQEKDSKQVMSKRSKSIDSSTRRGRRKTSGKRGGRISRSCECAKRTKKSSKNPSKASKNPKKTIISNSRYDLRKQQTGTKRTNLTGQEADSPLPGSSKSARLAISDQKKDLKASEKASKTMMKTQENELLSTIASSYSLPLEGPLQGPSAQDKEHEGQPSNAGCKEAQKEREIISERSETNNLVEEEVSQNQVEVAEEDSLPAEGPSGSSPPLRMDPEEEGSPSFVFKVPPLPRKSGSTRNKTIVASSSLEDVETNVLEDNPPRRPSPSSAVSSTTPNGSGEEVPSTEIPEECPQEGGIPSEDTENDLTSPLLTVYDSLSWERSLETPGLSFSSGEGPTLSYLRVEGRSRSLPVSRPCNSFERLFVLMEGTLQIFISGSTEPPLAFEARKGDSFRLKPGQALSLRNEKVREAELTVFHF